MSDPIVLDAGMYWKFRAIHADVANLEAEIRRATQQAEQKRSAVCVEAGLDPATNYQCDDATLTVTPVPR